ncbi:SRPBCC family protein [Myceligenerans salitolerans]|uniref:SRPBCC family protein n=1 Tax=Myceligenerans salitolerans TaxID=1230528 RepID=A0ABS3IEB4_9MICO|nr:SRPBCC family protein [Myceligenerans salitolerans]MBO0610352.1 SRPBCC family protein [Myceligenerans salitolerans]
MPAIRLETTVPTTVDECFRLCLSVDAHSASMSASGERAIAGVTHGEMDLGDTVTWQARHFGIPFRMTSGITELDRPHRFVDEQLAGPFAWWRHEHLFTRAEAGTRMVDVIDFRAPLGPLGALVERLALTRYMARLIRQRNSWLVAAASTS